MNLLNELKTRFPWLETDDCAPGADVVDQLCAWYHEVKQQRQEPQATIPADAKWDDPCEDGSVLILDSGLTVRFGDQTLQMHVSAFEVDGEGSFVTLGNSDEMTGHLYEAFGMSGTPQSIEINGRQYTLFMEPYGA